MFWTLGDVSRMPAILVIEDDPATAEEIRLELARHGFDVHVVNNGLSGLESARKPGWSAFVVDRMLPELDGLSVIRMLRA